MAIFRYRKDKNGRNRYQRIIEVYRNGKHIYKSKTFNSKREALDWEKKFLYELDAGIITKDSIKKRKLQDAVQKYISTVLPQKPRNAPNVIQHLKWWEEKIGHLQLSDVTPAVLAECRDVLLQEPNAKGNLRQNNTVIRYLASMSIVLECCVKEWLWISQNPMRSIKKPKVGKGKTRFFDLEEVRKIKALCAETDSRLLLPIFILALHSGMRKGEVLSLTWDNIDFKNKEIHLPITKNGEPRDVPMTEEVHQVFSDLGNAKQINISGLVFPSPSNPHKPIDIKSTWERVLEKAGIDDATFHTIRHTACSYLAQIGIPPILIARIVGHKDSRTTDRYTHAVKTHTRDAIDKYETLLKAGHHD
jgi:integrase